MKKIVFILFLFSIYANSQELIIGEGATISMGFGTSINILGLELTPFIPFEFSGENAISLSKEPVIAPGGNESIARVYTSLNIISDFLGLVVLNYEDDELNGIDETKLVLEVKDGDNIWQNYDFSGLDNDENTITFIIFDDFLGVTASSEDATLPVEDFENEFGAIAIYPNPTTSELKIESDKNLSFELYSPLGQRIFRTKSSTIEMSHLPNAVYLLRVTDEDSNFSKSYKILKK